MNKQIYSKLTKAELAEIFPPITRNNFVVRDNTFQRRVDRPDYLVKSSLSITTSLTLLGMSVD